MRDRQKEEKKTEDLSSGEGMQEVYVLPKAHLVDPWGIAMAGKRTERKFGEFENISHCISLTGFSDPQVGRR